ncbi:hypothetical protein [Kingella sp. (in: b-proteobacteria)]|uniref:hypothetical protein n=1 Tax=Kingella sp. (in: b-proteobacteria) TaxID=2020713 RepID=UPI0026DB6759|nr:hypothetical protein [Kingella sp. (in: b-proteobacteria)]MDO4658080.1 hypothetical protein [Kingella sp. (in: b-proteobacteria)]
MDNEISGYGKGFRLPFYSSQRTACQQAVGARGAFSGCLMLRSRLGSLKPLQNPKHHKK